ncbi:translocation/assembly module TamB domain-containing protein [Roseinatronobacter alkalisoli]|uniref:Translocation/assembly module TamB domain-containing protein n=1 Tax=Roseinatronobacter alkalisoli TaxID=3028235 RepID=A0ABT5T9P7_9RHOB|nr:translocation/assembly module TamB domain-containing protein [Roseinatronobacter sp. HJB301]MDD7971842.1 translocation/assembly module TamB domain-containing protein [Roseinatronobacter sp. HJB301]
MRILRIISLALVCLMTVLPVTVTAQGLEDIAPEPGESDVGFLTRLLQDSLSDRGRAVRISGFRGALSSRATFDEMTIEDDDGIWLRVTGATLQWNRSALFQRRIEIAEISAQRVEILRAPVSEAPEDLVPLRRFELPELPVSIDLGQLTFDEVVLGAPLLGQELRASVSGRATLADGEGDARLQIDRLDDIAGQFLLDAGFSNDTRILSLDLNVQEAPGGLAVTLLNVPDLPSVALRVQGEGPVDSFDAEIALDTDGQRRVTGEFGLQTTLPGVAQAVRLDLGGDLRPLLQPEFHPFFGGDSRLRTEARRFDDGRLSLDNLHIQTETLQLDGRVRMGADNLPELIDLRGEIRDRDGARVLLPVAGSDTSIEQADLRLVFDASVSDDWELVLDLIGFDNGDIAVESLFVNGLGRITSQGFGEDIDVIDALIDFSALGISARDQGLAEALGRSMTGSVAFIWREGRPLLLPGVLLEGRNFTINGRARLEDGVLFADGQAEFLDISRLSLLAGRPLSGAVRARAEGRIGPERDRFTVQTRFSGDDLTFGQEQLDRLLAGESVISLNADGRGGIVTLHELTAQAQTLRADLRGQVSQQDIRLRGDVDFADLSVLGGDFGGAIDARIAIDGPLEREAVVIEARAQDLTVGQQDANRALRGETLLQIEGRRDGAAFDLTALTLENAVLNLSATGRYAAGASQLDADFTLGSLGSVRPGFGGNIQGGVGLREDGDTRALDLELTARDLRLGNDVANRVLAGTNQVTARVIQRDDTLMIEDARLSGPNLTANISGESVQDRPVMRVDARLRDLALVAPGISGPVTLSGDVRDTGDAFALDLTASGPAGLSVQASGSISRDMRGDLRASGGGDIALINPRLEPRSVQGPARFDLALNGPLALSSVSGTAEATGAQLVLPRRNIRLTDISARAQLSGGRAAIDVQGRAAAGGNVSLTGNIDLTPPLNADLRARLTDVRIQDPQLFQTDVSGDVVISGALTQGPDLAGNLVLDGTEIRIPRVGLVSRGYIPPNIRHQGETATARQTRQRAGIFAGETHGRVRRPSSLDLTIDAPNRIFIRGRGLDAELGGQLRLTGTTADPIPIGQFGLIRGRLDLLGNRFTLNEGFASLQGDLVPFVRLVASTERSGITARIVLEGRADAPEIRFESTPELPEEEVVSLLLFGRGFETLSVLQAAQLASSLATLSGHGEGILERLRRNIGLDDLDVRTTEDGETSVRLGRYLTENIYTDVEIQPQGDSEVSINIDLSPSLTARGRIDNQGRAGIGLFFERDY